MQKLLLFLSLPVLILSCTKPINDLEITSPTTVSFTQNGGKSIVSMNAYSDWTAKCDAGWMTLSPASGTATSDGLKVSLSLLASANTEYQDRNCTISITSNGKVFTVSVTQSMKTAILISDKKQNIDYSAQKLNISGQKNVEYTVNIPSSCSEWVSLAPTKALESFSTLIDIKENETEKERKGYVIFKGTDNIAVDTLYINQGGKPSILFCETPGLYSGRDMLAGYTENVSQYGIIKRNGGTREFHIANAAERQYCIFTNFKLPEVDKIPGSTISVNVSQNIDRNTSFELSLSLLIHKYENGLIWGTDEKNNYGAIIKVD